jgi:hypothetical protein
MQCDLQTPATGKVDKNFDVGVHSRLEKAYISGHEFVPGKEITSGPSFVLWLALFWQPGTEMFP